MSKGSATVAVLAALLGGMVIGYLVGQSKAPGGEEIAADTGAATAEGTGGAIERFRFPVTRQQPVKGPEDALVTIIEVSDFECPFCSRVGPTMERIMKEYAGKVRVVWRNHPLPFHQKAGLAHQAAMEAFSQGGSAKFWKMHDLLFANQTAIERPALEGYAQQLGLDMTKFRQALDTNAHQATIQADLQAAQRLGANGTPAFFINGRSLSGAQPFESFKAIIDEELRSAEALVRAGTARGRVYAELTKNGLTAPPTAAAGANNAPPPPRQPPPVDTNVYRIPVASNQPVDGPADALVTIVEVSDFQCPFCSRVNPTMDAIKAKYGRDVRIVWMNNALPFHQNAMPAAIASQEAFVQGGSAKFWELHKVFFANQQTLDRPNLETYAQQVGLNMARFRAALDGQTHKPIIEAQMALANKLGARGTPAFFINGRKFTGAQPLENFVKLIDEELAKAKALVAGGTPRGRVYETIIREGLAEAPAAPANPQQPPDPNANKVFNIAAPARAPMRGSRTARVKIQLFSDFQCPFCGRVRPTLDQIATTYGNQVQVIWRNYPLPFHNNAMPAAQASLEVYRQGGDAKFWAYHDKLFENQQDLSRATLERLATELGGIDINQFKQALDSNRHEAAVKADMDAVTQAGAQIGTPSFFINGKLIQGAQPFEAFKAAIDAALAAR